jgi:hypothetical protein
MLLENPDAAAFGAAGLACQLIWPLFSARHAIPWLQMGIGACVSETLAILTFAPRTPRTSANLQSSPMTKA